MKKLVSFVKKYGTQGATLVITKLTERVKDMPNAERGHPKILPSIVRRDFALAQQVKSIVDELAQALGELPPMDFLDEEELKKDWSACRVVEETRAELAPVGYMVVGRRKHSGLVDEKYLDFVASEEEGILIAKADITKSQSYGATVYAMRSREIVEEHNRSLASREPNDIQVRTQVWSKDRY